VRQNWGGVGAGTDGRGGMSKTETLADVVRRVTDTLTVALSAVATAEDEIRSAYAELNKLDALDVSASAVADTPSPATEKKQLEAWNAWARGGVGA